MAVIAPYINSVYEQILKRPQMFAGHSQSIQAYVLALEGVLNFLADGSERKGQFVDVISDGQWRSEFFTQAFERRRVCELGFVSKAHPEAIVASRELMQEFEEEFRRHWTRFLASRKDGKTEQ